MAASNLHHFEAPALNLQETFETIGGKKGTEAHPGTSRTNVQIVNLSLIQCIKMKVMIVDNNSVYSFC